MKIDITGQHFNRLTAQWPVGLQNHETVWLCLCECGNLVLVTVSNLRCKAFGSNSARVKSCGCLHRPHGHATRVGDTPTYRSWTAMLARCTNSSRNNYHRYGGRGISVCERWKDFSNFLTDMGERPAGKQLERRDNNGNYEPGNCCWATPLEQAHNRGGRFEKLVS